MPIHQLTEIDLPLPEALTMKPSKIWEKIAHVAVSRYQHIFPDNINDYTPLTMKFNRLATLRDLLLTIGVSIEAKEYDFSHEQSQTSGANQEQKNKQTKDKQQQ